MTKILEVSGLGKAYNGKCILDTFSFSLDKGSIGCLLGESGCGKTTVLRLIAGFEPLQAGRIMINGRLVASAGHCVAPRHRHLGMVFQDYALFPHLSVKSNIAFGIRNHPGAERRRRVAEMLDLVGLSNDAGKYPHELSGGQQQRVALARALAPKPDLLLMDEPFSNLDVALRERLSAEVGKLLKSLGISALLVTHNQNEAFAMADEIGVLNNGRIEQWDTACNLYHRPQSPYVADFVGEGVLIEGIVKAQDQVATPLGTLQGSFSWPCRSGCAVNVLIRPEDIIHDDESPLKAGILRKDFRGANILYTLQLTGSQRLLALVSSHHDHSVGQQIGIRPKVDDIVLFETLSAR
jgi:iron(III) transport system ATP-binding protein